MQSRTPQNLIQMVHPCLSLFNNEFDYFFKCFCFLHLSCDISVNRM